MQILHSHCGEKRDAGALPATRDQLRLSHRPVGSGSDPPSEAGHCWRVGRRGRRQSALFSVIWRQRAARARGDARIRKAVTARGSDAGVESGVTKARLASSQRGLVCLSKLRWNAITNAARGRSLIEVGIERHSFPARPAHRSGARPNRDGLRSPPSFQICCPRRRANVKSSTRSCYTSEWRMSHLGPPRRERKLAFRLCCSDPQRRDKLLLAFPRSEDVLE